MFVGCGENVFVKRSIFFKDFRCHFICIIPYFVIDKLGVVLKIGSTPSHYLRKQKTKQSIAICSKIYSSIYTKKP